MKKAILLTIFVLGLFLISGCEFDLEKGVGSLSEEDMDILVKCEKPYVRHASGCCLDKNEDGICDQDEESCKTVKIPYQTTETYTIDEEYIVQEPYQDKQCVEIEVPYTVTEDRTETLFHLENKAITVGSRLGNVVNLKADTTVEVSFEADDTLNLWAMDKYNYDKVLGGASTADYLLKRQGVKSATASFKTTVEDNYAIYLKNTHWIETVSIFDFKAEAKWQETVEKTKTEQKCTTTTRYKDVKKTRPITKERIVTKYKTEKICS